MKISSDNKTILILSDIHEEIQKADHIINKVPHDHLVILGDVFDTHYYHTEDHFRDCFSWLQNIINKPNVTFLCGNHEGNYIMPYNQSFTCSGFTERKREIAEEFGLYKEYEKYFKFHVFVDDILCTHAGLQQVFVPPFCKELDEWLERETESAKIALLSGQAHWFWGCGRSRGGSQSTGGLVWCDAEREFTGVEGLKQIFGHTHNSADRIYIPRHFRTSNHDLDILTADNICIDTGLNEVLIIKDRKKQIISYEDL